jgi:hypothetical protein
LTRAAIAIAVVIAMSASRIRPRISALRARLAAL